VSPSLRVTSLLLDGREKQREPSSPVPFCRDGQQPRVVLISARLTHLQKGHAATDVLRFFKQIDATVPRGLAVHVILDNLSAHSAPEIATWLAHKNRRRWHLHFTPTSSSWLNLVERWFKELTDKRLRRGRFTSVDELTKAITTWAANWNADPKPFIWTATADEITAKVRRGRETLHQIKSTTDH
jgi:transposase